MPDTSAANSNPTDRQDTAEDVNDSTSTADAGEELSEDQKEALAAGVADPSSDSSLTE